MLTHGIPSFRLERDVIEAEIDVLRQMGVHFQCSTEVGKDVTIAQLREQGFKAFYIAIGAQKSTKLGIPGDSLKNVLGGIDFLREVNMGKKPRIGPRGEGYLHRLSPLADRDARRSGGGRGRYGRGREVPLPERARGDPR